MSDIIGGSVRTLFLMMAAVGSAVMLAALILTVLSFVRGGRRNKPEQLGMQTSPLNFGEGRDYSLTIPPPSLYLSERGVLILYINGVPVMRLRRTDKGWEEVE